MSALALDASPHARVMALLGTTDQFRTWLDSLPPNTIVGQCGQTRGCPIHEFLACDGILSSVGKYDVQDPLGWWQVPLPEWARTFVGMVDAHGLNSRISALECLEILGAIHD